MRIKSNRGEGTLKNFILDAYPGIQEEIHKFVQQLIQETKMLLAGVWFFDGMHLEHERENCPEAWGGE